jgi:hypothetical protein
MILFPLFLTRKKTISIVETIIEKYNNTSVVTFGICGIAKWVLSPFSDFQRKEYEHAFLKAFNKRYYKIFPNENPKDNKGYYYPFGYKIYKANNNVKWVKQYYLSSDSDKVLDLSIFVKTRVDFLKDWLNDLTKEK